MRWASQRRVEQRQCPTGELDGASCAAHRRRPQVRVCVQARGHACTCMRKRTFSHTHTLYTRVISAHALMRAHARPRTLAHPRVRGAGGLRCTWSACRRAARPRSHTGCGRRGTSATPRCAGTARGSVDSGRRRHVPLSSACSCALACVRPCARENQPLTHIRTHTIT